MSAVGMRGDDMRVRGETKGMFLGPLTLTRYRRAFARRSLLPWACLRWSGPPVWGERGYLYDPLSRREPSTVSDPRH